jgi:putative ABC transport system permease protein
VSIADSQVNGSPGSTRQLAIAARVRDVTRPAETTQYLSVGERFFETLALPIVRGRALTAADGDAEREGAVVNERFAALFFPNGDPIGQRIHLTDADAKTLVFPWLTIVGVSRPVPSPMMYNEDRPVVYQSFRADPMLPRSLTIVVADTPLATAASVVRAEVRALQPGLAVFAIEPLDAAVARGRGAQKLLGTWLGVLALIGLVLASLGVYALTAHNVVQRTQEIGLRMALGAPPGRVVWPFLRRSLTHLALGLACGVAGALPVGKLFGAFLLHAGARDYGTTALVALVLATVTIVASLVPARRASRVDPIVALRQN